MLRLGDCFDEENAALSDQICTGLQLANFWQDVARDYAIGRIYLPADAMSRFGVSESMLSQSSTPIELRQLLASECDRAEKFFRCGLPLADRVPRWLSSDIKLFAHGGLATLEAIRRIDFDVLRVATDCEQMASIGIGGPRDVGAVIAPLIRDRMPGILRQPMSGRIVMIEHHDLADLRFRKLSPSASNQPAQRQQLLSIVLVAPAA